MKIYWFTSYGSFYPTPSWLGIADIWRICRLWTGREQPEAFHFEARTLALCYGTLYKFLANSWKRAETVEIYLCTRHAKYRKYRRSPWFILWRYNQQKKWRKQYHSQETRVCKSQMAGRRKKLNLPVLTFCKRKFMSLRKSGEKRQMK